MLNITFNDLYMAHSVRLRFLGLCNSKGNVAVYTMGCFFGTYVNVLPVIFPYCEGIKVYENLLIVELTSVTQREQIC